jgi:hypothetical protein
MLDSSRQHTYADGTSSLRLAAPVMGLAAAAVLPVIWSAIVAIATAAACLYFADDSRRTTHSPRALRRLKIAGMVTGHLVYVMAIYFAWLAIDRITGPDVGGILFTFLLIMLSFSAWLVSGLLRGAWAVVMCWVVFVSIATAMTGLRFFVMCVVCEGK